MVINPAKSSLDSNHEMTAISVLNIDYLGVQNSYDWCQATNSYILLHLIIMHVMTSQGVKKERLICVDNQNL